MITDTPSPSPSPTFTLTLTPSATPTATPDYYLVMTTPEGAPARIAREGTIFDVVIVLMLFAIFLSMWAMWFNLRMRERSQ